MSTGSPAFAGDDDGGRSDLPYAFMLSKNSPFVLVERSLSSRKSIASMVPIGLRMRRRMYIFLSWSGGVSSSSLRVPERVMSIAGKVRLSAQLRAGGGLECGGA